MTSLFFYERLAVSFMLWLKLASFCTYIYIFEYSGLNIWQNICIQRSQRSNRRESWVWSARSTRLQNHSQAIPDQIPPDPLGDKHRGALYMEYTAYIQHFQKLFIFWYKRLHLCNNIFNYLYLCNVLEVLNNYRYQSQDLYIHVYLNTGIVFKYI